MTSDMYDGPGDAEATEATQRRMERRAARYDGSSRRRGSEARSRMLALAVFLALTIVVVLVMVAMSPGEGAGTADTVPVSLLPVTPEFQQDEQAGDNTTSTTASAMTEVFRVAYASVTDGGS